MMLRKSEWYAMNDQPKSTEIQPNLILTHGYNLLLILAELNHLSMTTDLVRLQKYLAEEVHLFIHQLEQLGFQRRSLYALRYCICTALDEAVMRHDWVEEAKWSSRSLLYQFHKDNFGGERFYIILEDLLHDPQLNMDSLEYLYLILSLGFEGKCHGSKRTERDELCRRIFYLIRRFKPTEAAQLLLTQEHGTSVTEDKAFSWLNPLSVISISLAVTLFAVFNFISYQQVKPTVQLMQHIPSVSATTVQHEFRRQAGS